MRLCDEFDDEHPTPPIVNRVYCLQSLQESVKHPIMYLFPPVILWSPLEQFRDIQRIDTMCRKCVSLGHNDISLHATGWRNGPHGEQSEPRKFMKLMV